MKVLLINNASKSTENIKRMLNDFDVFEYSHKDIPLDTSNFDFAVLSGGTLKPAFYEESEYQKEIDFIKNSNIPIFGICLGMQLISQAFSPNRLKELPKKKRGNIKIKIDKKIFGINEIEVNEGHKWSVVEINEPLEILGESEDGVEIIKHKSKNIWGTQFHPQADPENGTNGELVFRKFIISIS